MDVLENHTDCWTLEPPIHTASPASPALSPSTRAVGRLEPLHSIHRGSVPTILFPTTYRLPVQLQQTTFFGFRFFVFGKGRLARCAELTLTGVLVGVG